MEVTKNFGSDSPETVNLGPSDLQPVDKDLIGSLYTPWNIQSVWPEPVSTTPCLTASILLPSGVKPSDVNDIQVMDDGRQLNLVITWPQQFYYV